MQKIEIVYEKIRQEVNSRIGSQMHMFTASHAQALLINQTVTGNNVAGTTPPVWLNHTEALASSDVAVEAFEQVKTCLRNKQLMILPLPTGTEKTGHFVLYVCFKLIYFNCLFTFVRSTQTF